MPLFNFFTTLCSGCSNPHARPPLFQLADQQGTKMAVVAICRACVEAGAWPALNDNILLISKRRSQLKQAITVMVQECMGVLDRTPSIEVRGLYSLIVFSNHNVCVSSYFLNL